MDKTEILIHLPHLLKSLLVNIEGRISHKKRYGSEYERFLDEFAMTDNQRITKADLFIQLQPLLQNIPYYKSLEIKSFDDIPIVDKSIIHNNIKDFILNEDVLLEYAHTSGTSGSPFIFPVSSKIIQKHFAATDFFRSLNQLSRKQVNANFIGRTFLKIKQDKEPYWVYNKASNQLLLSQYHISDRTVSAYLEALKKYKVEWIHGYPSTMANLASLINNNNLQDEVLSLDLKGITLGSETLYDNQKKLIEKTFKTKTYNYYCQSESVAAIYECPMGHLHINEDFSYVELIHEEDNLYRIVGTQIDNECMPFIRYDTKDLVEIDEVFKCGCGAKGRVVKRIVGRQDDYVTLFDGRKVGRLDHIFKDMSGIVEAQIRQYDKGKAEFWLMADPNCNKREVEKKLRDQIHQKLGNDFNYNILYKDSIPRTKSGKFRLVISDIK